MCFECVDVDCVVVVGVDVWVVGVGYDVVVVYLYYYCCFLLGVECLGLCG